MIAIVYYLHNNGTFFFSFLEACAGVSQPKLDNMIVRTLLPLFDYAVLLLRETQQTYSEIISDFNN